MNSIPTSLTVACYIVLFLYGIVIGSFANVCICRIPRKESIVKVRSHCENCGYTLKWYDLIPIFSYLCLGGKCRKCGRKISVWHLLMEVSNGVLYVLVYTVCGFSVETLLYCLAGSTLLILAVIDFKTYEIPAGCNLFLTALGVFRVATDPRNWVSYLIGFFSVSVFLYFLYLLSKGRAIGGGDIKLMAAAGLLLGWKCILLAFVLGCIWGSVIHLIRMKVSKEDHVLAMGPYLAVGIMIAALWGNALIQWYLTSMGL